MSPWTFTIIDGFLTGIGLYAPVRLRLYLGPIAGRQIGAWGRRAVWVLLIAAMVIVAELDVNWLRDRLEKTNAPGTGWYYEAVYASVFLAMGLAVAGLRILRRSSKKGDQSAANANEKVNCLRRIQ